MRIVRRGHALEGQELAVLGRCKRAGQLHLLLILPCESRSLIPASWTDLTLRIGAAADDVSPVRTATWMSTWRSSLWNNASWISFRGRFRFFSTSLLKALSGET